MKDWNQELNRWWERYADACWAPEPSADFMPGVWRKIEARRGLLWQVRFFAKRLALSAAAVSLVLLAIGFSPIGAGNAAYQMTYLDSLEAEAQPETLAFVPAFLADASGAENSR